MANANPFESGKAPTFHLTGKADKLIPATMDPTEAAAGVTTRSGLHLSSQKPQSHLCATLAQRTGSTTGKKPHHGSNTRRKRDGDRHQEEAQHRRQRKWQPMEKPSVDHPEPTDRKPAPKDQKPTEVSSCSSEEQAAPEAPRSARITTSDAVSTHNSALGSISPEVVSASTLLGNGSAISPMSETMRDCLQSQLPPLQSHHQFRKTKAAENPDIFAASPVTSGQPVLQGMEMTIASPNDSGTPLSVNDEYSPPHIQDLIAELKDTQYFTYISGLGR